MQSMTNYSDSQIHTGFMNVKIEFNNHGIYSTLTITNNALFLRRHAQVAIAAVDSAPSAKVITTGCWVLRTVLSGETQEIWRAGLAARRVAQKYGGNKCER